MAFIEKPLNQLFISWVSRILKIFSDVIVNEQILDRPIALMAISIISISYVSKKPCGALLTEPFVANSMS